MKLNYIILLYLFTFVSLKAVSQVSVKDSLVFAPMIDFSYGYKIPGGDLEKRFGAHSEIGIAFLIKTKSNFYYGLDWNYIFGNEVHETSFADGFRDDNGGILANNGLYSEIYFVERGFSLSAKVGYVFSVLGPNPNSGIMILGGVGFLEHRIKMEDKYDEVPMLSGDKYYQGYDRLTNGLMLTEFIGYRLLSDRRLVNLFAGFEFQQAFTRNRRDINFDTGVKDDLNRLDMTMGFKIGFSLLFYKQVPHEYYYK